MIDDGDADIVESYQEDEDVESDQESEEEDNVESPDNVESESEEPAPKRIRIRTKASL